MASWNFFSRWHRDSWLLECLVKCHNQLIFSISGNNCNRFMVQEKAEVVCDVCFSGIGDENIEALIMIWSMHQTPAIFSTWISGRTLLWVGSWVHYILLYDQTAAWVLWIAADVGHPVPMSIAWFLAWDWYLNYYFFHPHAHHDPYPTSCCIVIAWKLGGGSIVGVTRKFCWGRDGYHGGDVMFGFLRLIGSWGKLFLQKCIGMLLGCSAVDNWLLLAVNSTKAAWPAAKVCTKFAHQWGQCWHLFSMNDSWCH